MTEVPQCLSIISRNQHLKSNCTVALNGTMAGFSSKVLRVNVKGMQCDTPCCIHWLDCTNTERMHDDRIGHRQRMHTNNHKCSSAAGLCKKWIRILRDTEIRSHVHIQQHKVLCTTRSALASFLSCMNANKNITSQFVGCRLSCAFS